MGLNKFDLVRGQVVFAVKLPVDFRHRLAPVSYTHLKPCEPQVFAFRAIRCELPGLRGTGLAASPFFQPGSIPVSYTHLDVYKRQV